MRREYSQSASTTTYRLTVVAPPGFVHRFRPQSLIARAFPTVQRHSTAHCRLNLRPPGGLLQMGVSPSLTHVAPTLTRATILSESLCMLLSHDTILRSLTKEERSRYSQLFTQPPYRKCACVEIAFGFKLPSLLTIANSKRREIASCPLPVGRSVHVVERKTAVAAVDTLAIATCSAKLIIFMSIPGAGGARVRS